MANNIAVKDAAAATVTVKSTDNAGVHTPSQNVDQLASGQAAHDAGVAGNPITVGGVASAAAPSAVSADQDSVRAWYLRNGAAMVGIQAAGALVGGDATNGLDVDVTRISPDAHDASATANPVLVAGFASAAAPSAVSADGDVVRAWYLRNGAQATALTAAGALIGGDAPNGLDVDPTREAPNPSATSATFSEGSKTVAATATPERLVASTTRVQSVELMANKGQNTANVGDVFIGFASGNGTQFRRLQSWQTLSFEAPPGKKIDLNLIWIDVLNAGDGVSYLAVD